MVLLAFSHSTEIQNKDNTNILSTGCKIGNKNTTYKKLGYRRGRMFKADNFSPRGPGFESHESKKAFSVYSMYAMINASMTRLTLNRLQKV